MHLVGVEPDFGPAADILCQPDKQGDQCKTQEQAHLVAVTKDAVMHARSEKHNKGCCEEERSQVGHKVMREEIDIDADAQTHRQEQRRIVLVSHVKDAGDSGDIGTNGCIHEAGEQGHSADLEIAEFWIGPRPMTGFENFHCRSDNVENQNDQSL